MTQGSNPGPLHCRQILYQLYTREAQEYWRGGSLFLLQGIFMTQELNQGLLHCRRIFYQLIYQGSPKMCRPLYLMTLLCFSIDSDGVCLVMQFNQDTL